MSIISEIFLPSPYGVVLAVGAIILGLTYLWKEIIIEFVKVQINIWSLVASLPGPGFLELVNINTNETADLLLKWSRKFSKTYRLILGPVVKIVITDPRDIEILLDSPLAEEKDEICDLMRSFLTNSLVNSKDAVYRSHKKLIMPLVNGKSLPTYVKEGNKFSRRFVELLDEKVGKGEFDMHICISRAKKIACGINS